MTESTLQSTTLDPIEKRFGEVPARRENGAHHPYDSVDEGITAIAHNVQEGFRHRLHDWEDFVQRSPTNSMVTAFAAGYLLRMLPVEQIAAAQVRLLVSLIRPALFLYGTAKVYDYFLKHKSQAEK